MYTSNRLRPPARGVGLLELVIAIVVIGIAMSALPPLLRDATLNSTDPMLKIQAVNIASAYIEEIMLQSYADPDAASGSEDGDVSCESGPLETRADYDDVGDYACINNAAVEDRAGRSAADLAAYRVSVSVAGNQCVQGRPAKGITVSVDHSAIETVVMKAFRVKFGNFSC